MAADNVMSSAGLQDLVAPAALYPDTLLIQILVAATYPLDIVKADRLVRDRADATGGAIARAVQNWLSLQIWNVSGRQV
ncbi:MAG: DUF3300 domain-containing protein [Marinibacterium sp.]|nr:DUF3300 domain-containing protein [Marinibacterium sp.]